MSWEYSKPQAIGEILVALPYKAEFSAKFVAGLMGLKYPDYFAHSVYFQTGQPLDIGRNIMVSNALQRNVSHIFFLDSDIILKADTILNLYNSFMPIIGGVYFGRSPPYDVVANLEDRTLTRNDIVDLRERNQMLKEVINMGMGCCLVDMRVFKRIAQFHDLKWFCIQKHPNKYAELEKDDSGIYYDNNEAIETNYICDECKGSLIAPFFDYRIGKYSENSLSEDYYFCKLARQAGFSIYLSTSIDVEHEVTMFTIGMDGLTNSTQSAGII